MKKVLTTIVLAGFIMAVIGAFPTTVTAKSEISEATPVFVVASEVEVASEEILVQEKAEALIERAETPEVVMLKGATTQGTAVEVTQAIAEPVVKTETKAVASQAQTKTSVATPSAAKPEPTPTPAPTPAPVVTPAPKPEPTPTPVVEAPATNPSYNVMSSVEKDILSEVNAVRANAGLPALTWDNTLAASARDHSATMFINNRFAHTQKYNVKENIFSLGTSNSSKFTASNIVTKWMQSADQKANLLDPNVTKLGAGVVVGEQWNTTHGVFVNTMYGTSHFR